MTKTYDIECLSNYTLFAFMDEDEKVYKIEMKGNDGVLGKKDRVTLLSLLSDGLIITFNGIGYDMIITAGAIGGLTCEELYQVSKRIIEDRVPPWKMYRGRIKELTNINHVDLIETAPAVMTGLKKYGARLLSKRLWEYDVDWNEPLSKEDRKGLKKYCTNDLILTWDLYRKILPSIELRELLGDKYDLDLRSKSDAQIAEAVIVSELGGDVRKPSIPKRVSYTPPSWIKFESKELKTLLTRFSNETFDVNQSNGQVIAPTWLKNMIVRLGEAQFQVGLGGLHSMEKQLTVKSTKKIALRNADVASYYPRIIINSKLFPSHLGEKFLDVYESLVERRLKAKAEGDKGTSETLKIVLNGSFGKFGSKYSKLYAPNLLVAVTFTGQLALLMLIEQLELNGVIVVSANTDGVEYSCPRKRVKKALKIISKWESITGYTMENDEYISLHARDVNNYIAKYKDYVKSKGVYKKLDDQPILKKDPQVPICFTAVRDYIEHGKPLRKTIRKCKDVAQFCSARVVNGGAMYKGEKLGKTVRWYYNRSGEAIHYVKANKTGNHNKVPLTDDCKPMMDLTDKIPSDLDYDWYFNYALRMLGELG